MTLGQQLYEHEHPRFIQVFTARTFGEPILIENPEHVVPWRLLTERCRQEYEDYAIGHHLFSHLRGQP